MTNGPWQQVLVYFLSSIKTFLFRTLTLLIFGFAFLFLFHPLNGNSIFDYLQLFAFDFTEVNLTTPEKTLQSFVLAYVLGLLLDTFGVWCFRFFRNNLKLESYIIKRWRIRKRPLLCSLNEQRKKSLCEINDAQIHSYLELHPYVADVYTLEQFFSTITRPLFSIFFFAVIFFSQGWYILILVSITLFLIAVGVYADREANAFGDQVKKVL